MKKLKIRAIYYSQKYADCYTVYFNDFYFSRGQKLFNCLCMSENPFHPQGIGQHSSGMLGNHNGKKIAFEALPRDCQKIVSMEF
jgi:hypothetical protein